jgi:uncharacterized protein YndB with AHSA1/START domain
MNTSFPSDREIVMTRRYDFPVARVFAAFTGPGIDRWWGPDGFVTTTSARDVRVGGEWIYEMRHATYGAFPNRIRYVEIVPDTRLVYDHDAGADDPTPAFRVVATFAARDGGTELTMHTTFTTVEACQNARQFGAIEMGWQTWARLDAALREA